MTRKQIQLFAALVAAAALQGSAALGQTPTPPAEQLACNDGTIAANEAGACSEHGGIASRSTVSSAPTAASPTTVPEEPGTVLCKDGTSMKRADGACANHGGAAGPMTPFATSANPAKSEQGTGGSGSAGIAPTEPKPGSAAKPENAPQANTSQATAQCKDGTLLYGPQSEGVCSDHGGLHQWLTGTSR
jgi:hypothetical protein